MVPYDIPSLRQLRAFQAVARLGNISRAAREVSLSQPALTQSLHALEAKLGITLFSRRRSGCYTTELGAILLPRVQRFFEQIRSALGGSAVGAPFTRLQNAETIINKLTRSQILSLIGISENQSLEAASHSLGITPTSLHRCAKQLEGELGRSLYQRMASGITTTTQGSELARRFQLALSEIDYGFQEVRAAQGNVISRVAIGNIPHSNSLILSAAIDGLLRAYPSASVKVSEGRYGALLNELRAGRLDFIFGVLRRPEWARDVKEEQLFSYSYVLVVRRGHPLTSLPAIRLHDLTRYDWILPDPSTPRRQAFEEMFSTSKDRPRVSIEATTMSVYRAILASSDRLTLMSQPEAQLNDQSALTVLPYRSPCLSRADGVATRLDWQPTSIHRQFLDLLRAQALLQKVPSAIQPRKAAQSKLIA